MSLHCGQLVSPLASKGFTNLGSGVDNVRWAERLVYFTRAGHAANGGVLDFLAAVASYVS
jgi:hypothetical protein